MKKRWFVGLTVFLLIAVLVIPQAAADIHFFFTHQTERLTLNPLMGWSAVLCEGKALRFYLLFCAVIGALLLGILLTGSSLNYRSGSWVVTPEIVTPSASGQGQFGTARWLSNEQIHRHFGVWNIRSANNTELQALLEAGKNDREEIQNANIQID